MTEPTPPLLPRPEPRILCVLTQYKRTYLRQQLEAVRAQTCAPAYIVVFQNESHVDISDLKKEFGFLHIHSDYNTKYFGRFAACFTFPVDVCIVMDDDIIPGPRCFETYVDECLKYNAIMGGNGRIGQLNPARSGLKAPPDVGVRPMSVRVDFVGHMWVFKKEWLHYMFAKPPATYDTGEDMHFCFSAQLDGGIASFACKQASTAEMCDTSYNRYAADAHASFRTTSAELRRSVEAHFIALGFKMITSQ